MNQNKELSEVKRTGVLVSNIIDSVLTIEDVADVIDSVEKIIGDVEKLLDLVSQPYKANLGNLKNQLRFIVNKIKKKNEKQDKLIDILNTLGNYVSKESETIINNVRETVTLELAFDKDLKNIPAPRIVLWDANFTKLISNKALVSKKSNYDIKITGQNILLKTVIEELQHKSGGRITLVSNSFLNYLRSFAVFFEDFLPLATNQEEGEIISKWKLTTKGESGDEDYFKSTGDFEIILYCYRTHNYPIIVLSDDTEINDIVRLFKTNTLFANVNVYTLDNYDLKQAA